LSELAKAIRLLAALHPTQPTGDELLKAAQALAGATAGLLNSAQPSNMEVSLSAQEYFLQYPGLPHNSYKIPTAKTVM